LMTTGVIETLDRGFWEHEVAEHEDGAVTAYHAPASMGGQGDAVAIRETYMWDSGQGKVAMQGARLGSIYDGMRYVASCAARAEAYDKYAPTFGTIIGSVRLDSRYHPFEIGYYRNFLADRKLALPRTKPGTIQPKNELYLSSGY